MLHYSILSGIWELGDFNAFPTLWLHVPLTIYSLYLKIYSLATKTINRDMIKYRILSRFRSP